MECGLVCFVMIVLWYGCEMMLCMLCNCYLVWIDFGLLFFDLMEIVNDFGLCVCGLQFDVGEFDVLKMLCILYWGMNYYVVLMKVGYGSVYIVDFVFGEMKLLFVQVFMYIIGYVFELNLDIGFMWVGQVDWIWLCDYFEGLIGICKSFVIGIVGGVVVQFLLLFGLLYV